ncbi:MAG: nuclease-related domain-containing protein [Candidatus Aquicultorales bacterium]
MLSALLFLLPFLLAFAVLYGTNFVLDMYRRRRRHSRWKNPLTRELLRGPGHSLQLAVDDKVSDFYAYLLLTTMLPLAVFAGHLASSYLGGERETVIRIVISLASGIGGIIYSVWMCLKTRKTLDRLRLGHEGEMAVGQELDQLMLLGCHVFHDFPAEGFNIDHIVVGPAGVFAVETKMKKKPLRDDGKSGHRVVYDGKYLKFPGWTEKEDLEQTARQAKWLGRWIQGSTQEKVVVKPMLALPGWMVDRSAKASSVIVFNPKNCGWLFKATGMPVLTKKQIDIIAFQLDRHCRDVETYPHIDRTAVQDKNRPVFAGKGS